MWGDTADAVGSVFMLLGACAHLIAGMFFVFNDHPEAGFLSMACGYLVFIMRRLDEGA